MNIDIGFGIRKMMGAKHISQSKLAKAVGVTRPYMCHLCSLDNDTVPSLPLLEKISKELKCELWELIKECKND